MAQRGAQEVQRQDSSNSVAEKNQKTARLTLRNGVWYVGEKRLNDFREALQTTLRTAEIAAAAKKEKPAPGPANPPGRGRCRLRLEMRSWWPAYLAWRDVRAEVPKDLVIARDNQIVETLPASATLRERAMTALADRRRA